MCSICHSSTVISLILNKDLLSWFKRISIHVNICNSSAYIIVIAKLLLFLELWRWLWSYPRAGWNLTITFIIQYFIQIESKWWNYCFLWMMSSATPSSSSFSRIVTRTHWNGSFMSWARLFYIRLRFLLRWVLLLFIAFIFVD